MYNDHVKIQIVYLSPLSDIKFTTNRPEMTLGVGRTLKLQQPTYNQPATHCAPVVHHIFDGVNMQAPLRLSSIFQHVQNSHRPNQACWPDLNGDHICHLLLVNQSEWPNEKCIHLPFWKIVESEGLGSNLGLAVFEPWLSQTIEFKIDLAWWSALLGLGKDWLAQCQHNATEWNSRSWCQQPGVPGRQHYKVTMSAYCHKSVPTLSGLVSQL